jgi:hypothetical protein
VGFRPAPRRTTRSPERETSTRSGATLLRTTVSPSPKAASMRMESNFPPVHGEFLLTRRLADRKARCNGLARCNSRNWPVTRFQTGWSFCQQQAVCVKCRLHPIAIATRPRLDMLFWPWRNRLLLGGGPPLMGGIGPTTGGLAQQIPGISNRIGKTADPATHFSNFPGNSSWAKRAK